MDVSDALKPRKRGNPNCVVGGPSNNPAGRPAAGYQDFKERLAYWISHKTIGEIRELVSGKGDDNMLGIDAMVAMRIKRACDADGNADFNSVLDRLLGKPSITGELNVTHGMAERLDRADRMIQERQRSISHGAVSSAEDVSHSSGSALEQISAPLIEQAVAVAMEDDELADASIAECTEADNSLIESYQHSSENSPASFYRRKSSPNVPETSKDLVNQEVNVVLPVQPQADQLTDLPKAEHAACAARPADLPKAQPDAAIASYYSAEPTMRQRARLGVHKARAKPVVMPAIPESVQEPAQAPDQPAGDQAKNLSPEGGPGVAPSRPIS